jgi:tetratricopeptide (TPR) repeat protein
MPLLRSAAIVLAAVFSVLSPVGAQAGVKASADVSTDHGPVHIDFAVWGPAKYAFLALRRADHSKPQIITLLYPDQVLALLADKQMEPMWQAVTQWAGSTLEPLRDRSISNLRKAYRNGSPDYFLTQGGERAIIDSPLDLRVQALLQLTYYLRSVGQYGEAEQLLRDNLTKMMLKPNSDRSILNWEVVALEIAAVRYARGDIPGALSQYATVEATLGDNPYVVNAMVSRAAALAKNGQYQEALTVIDAALAKLKEPANGVSPSKNRVVPVPGAELQFAWIRACALQGLGRTNEAETALQPLLKESGVNTTEEVEDVVLRAEVCMRDLPVLKKQFGHRFRDDVI